MDYTELTPDQQYQIVAGRLRQYEQQHLQAMIDSAAATASDETDQAAALAAQAAKWEQAAAAVRKILAGMPKPTASTPSATGQTAVRGRQTRPIR